VNGLLSCKETTLVNTWFVCPCGAPARVVDEHHTGSARYSDLQLLLIISIIKFNSY